MNVLNTLAVHIHKVFSISILLVIHFYFEDEENDANEAHSTSNLQYCFLVCNEKHEDELKIKGNLDIHIIHIWGNIIVMKKCFSQVLSHLYNMRVIHVLTL